jgi:hypothetical protein
LSFVRAGENELFGGHEPLAVITVSQGWQLMPQLDECFNDGIEAGCFPA